MTPTPNPTLIEKLIPPTISLILTSTFSVLVGIYLERFKNKLITLKYNISFSPLGTSINDNYWGNIQVTHNERPVNYLNFVTINIFNDNNNDIPKELFLDIWVNQQAQILGFNSNYIETGNAINLEANYLDRYNTALNNLVEANKIRATNPNYMLSQTLNQEIAWVQSNKKFHLPIFNRNSSAKINLLVESFDGKMPIVSISILQTSVKLIKQVDSDVEKKKKDLLINIMQISINVIGIYLLLVYLVQDSTIVFSTIGVGFVSYVLARFFYIAAKFIKRMFW